jgi:hypothetical protein
LNVAQHLAKAERNKSFLNTYLLKILDKCPDWASVVAFYSALHFIEAFLRKNHNINFEYHEERHRYMSQCLPEIFNKYYRLFDLGFTSRYKSVRDSPTAEEVKSAIDFELSGIEEFVRDRL